MPYGWIHTDDGADVVSEPEGSAKRFGPYPFSTGVVVDNADNLFFALEVQTRSIYLKDFFTDPISGDSVMVHETAHQRYGNSVALARGSTYGSTRVGSCWLESMRA